MKYANKNAEEKSGECNHSTEKAVTANLLLGTDTIPNGHIGDLCKDVSLWFFAYLCSLSNYLVLVWI
jgi:hypothetical protein